LLERENARAFRDQLLDIPIRADWVNWIFTANSLAEIPAPISDRLLILQMQLPTAILHTDGAKRVSAPLAKLKKL